MPRVEQVWAVSMFKDEADVAYHTVMHLAGEGVDGIIVADNGSTDGTRAELERAAADLAASGMEEERRCRLIVVDDPEIGYYQSRKMTALADQAGELGAHWIVPFDADEIWYGKERMADMFRTMSQATGVVHAVLYNHFRTGLDLDVVNPFQSMTWRQPGPGALPKVAFRYKKGAVIHQGNHGVDGVRGAVASGLLIRHFPYRSWEHFKRKAENGAKAYEATDLAAAEGAHWRGYGQILERHGEGALKEVYDRYFQFLSPVNEGMVEDPAPFRRFNTR
jgi:glycosyltransferase involved in cell wall biosynthesis